MSDYTYTDDEPLPPVSPHVDAHDEIARLAAADATLLRYMMRATFTPCKRAKDAHGHELAPHPRLEVWTPEQRVRVEYEVNHRGRKLSFAEQMAHCESVNAELGAARR